MSQIQREVAGDRIDVDDSLPSVEVPREILNELYSHALATQPEECCGLVIGTDDERFRTIVRCRNEMTLRHREDPVEYPRDGRHAYYMNALDYLRAIEEAEAQGERITGVFHSHIDAGAYLSEMDRAYAESAGFPFPDADQLVVSVVSGKVDSVAFFGREPETRNFLGRTIVPTGP
jgi:proteasome lid subunit RPN8/RPN11